MREMNFFQNLEVVSLAMRDRRGGPFADAVHGQDHGFFKGRRKEGAGGVAQMVLGEEEFLDSNPARDRAA